ncbi:hypothetical protein [Novosphingobium taihuense]|nr:hypothetical protein [Novosphingobium taihuense]TWH84769.1 hypothetical protein IQ25_02524 [Novosphingobium taihuense]
MAGDSTDEMALLSRRMLLGGGMAMGAAAALPAFAASTTSASSLPRETGIPADEKSRIDIIRRVRLRTDPGLVCWFFRGRNYAQQGANLIPLCELNFGAVMMVQPNADGTMDVTQYELGFRTAPGSATFAEKLHNPITGEMVDTSFAPVGPTSVHYDAHNVLQLPETIGGSSFTLEHVPELFYHVGDTIAFQTHSRARAVTPGKPDRVLNDMSMICSPAVEALNPKVHFASANAHGTDVTDYARWWKMPPGSGTQTLRSFGQKVASFAEMPEDWRTMLARFDPVMAADPVAGLKRKALEYRN